MKIFLIGATGYIGSAVAQKLKLKGHQIIALSRSETSAIKLQGLGYSVIKGDMLKPENWIEQASQAEGFIHCGQIKFGKRIGMNWVNKAAHADKIAFEGIIKAAKQSQSCKVILYTSSSSVIGDHGDEWIDENTTPKPIQTVDSYHLEGEQLAHEAFKSGLPVVILRPSLPVSSKPGGTFTSHFLSSAEKGRLQIVGDGKNYCPTIHIDDLAQAYVLSIQNPIAGETFIISDDNPLTLEELSNTLLKHFGKTDAKKVPKWVVSLFAGKLLATLLVSSFRLKNNKAKRILGWAPQYPTFYDSLRQITNSKNELNTQ